MAVQQQEAQAFNDTPEWVKGLKAGDALVFHRHAADFPPVKVVEITLDRIVGTKLKAELVVPHDMVFNHHYSAYEASPATMRVLDEPMEGTEEENRVTITWKRYGRSPGIGIGYDSSLTSCCSVMCCSITHGKDDTTCVVRPASVDLRKLWLDGKSFNEHAFVLQAGDTYFSSPYTASAMAANLRKLSADHKAKRDRKCKTEAIKKLCSNKRKREGEA